MRCQGCDSPCNPGGLLSSACRGAPSHTPSHGPASALLLSPGVKGALSFPSPGVSSSPNPRALRASHPKQGEINQPKAIRGPGEEMPRGFQAGKKPLPTMPCPPSACPHLPGSLPWKRGGQSDFHLSWMCWEPPVGPDPPEATEDFHPQGRSRSGHPERSVEL